MKWRLPKLFAHSIGFLKNNKLDKTRTRKKKGIYIVVNAIYIYFVIA